MPACGHFCLILCAASLAELLQARGASQRFLQSPTCSGNESTIGVGDSTDPPAPDPSKWNPSWDDWKGATTAGSSAIADIAQEASLGPSAVQTGKVLSDIGGMASVLIPPPAGIVVGGVLGTIGGLLGMGPSATTTALKNIEAGIQKLSKKVDTVINKLDVLQGVVNFIAAQQAEILQITEKTYKDLFEGPLKTLGQYYRQSMMYLKSAAKCPDDPSYMATWANYIQQVFIPVSGAPAEKLVVSEVIAFLNTLVTETSGKRYCDAAIAYHLIAQTRMQLFHIEYINSGIDSSGATFTANENSVAFAGRLHQDLVGYNATLYDLHMQWLVAQPFTTLNDMWRHPPFKWISPLQSDHGMPPQNGKAYWVTRPHLWTPLSQIAPGYSKAPPSACKDAKAFLEDTSKVPKWTYEGKTYYLEVVLALTKKGCHLCAYEEGKLWESCGIFRPLSMWILSNDCYYGTHDSLENPR
jgi:hypothetical protein